jgi:hypothetical protein
MSCKGGNDDILIFRRCYASFEQTFNFDVFVTGLIDISGFLTVKYDILQQSQFRARTEEINLEEEGWTVHSSPHCCQVTTRFSG